MAFASQSSSPILASGAASAAACRWRARLSDEAGLGVTPPMEALKPYLVLEPGG